MTDNLKCKVTTVSNYNVDLYDEVDEKIQTILNKTEVKKYQLYFTQGRCTIVTWSTK